jgi:acyl-coenzyme A thioesterase PaaI-like protein
LAVFKPMAEHQSYPGRLHGGIAAAILDETIGRAIMMKYTEEIWGVTLEFTIRFKEPIPLNEEVRVIGRITEDSNRSFAGTGEILLQDGTVAAEGWGKYIKLPLEKIADFDVEAQEWRVVPADNDPETVEV